MKKYTRPPALDGASLFFSYEGFTHPLSLYYQHPSLAFEILVPWMADQTERMAVTCWTYLAKHIINGIAVALKTWVCSRDERIFTWSLFIPFAILLSANFSVKDECEVSFFLFYFFFITINIVGSLLNDVLRSNTVSLNCYVKNVDYLKFILREIFTSLFLRANVCSFMNKGCF